MMKKALATEFLKIIKNRFLCLVFNQPRCHGSSTQLNQNARINPSVVDLVSCKKREPRNLGDWKNAMLLSFASDALSSRLSETGSDPQIPLAFPGPLEDIKPHAIAVSRLNPSLKQTTTSGEEPTDSSADDKSTALSTTARKRQKSKQGAVNFGIEVDDKIVKEVSKILEAGVVAGLDLAPSILTGLVSELKQVTSLFEWIVPEEFYLPYPPAYCPQPMNLKKVTWHLPS